MKKQALTQYSCVKCKRNNFALPGGFSLKGAPRPTLLREVLANGFVELDDMVIVETIEDLAAHLAIAHDSRCLQGTQLMGDCGFGDREEIGEIADATFLIREE